MRPAAPKTSGRPPAPGALRGVLAGLLVGPALVVCPAPLAAADKPEGPLLAPASADSVEKDLAVAVHARRALADDDRLRPLNLRVKLAGGVATLQGAVPSADLIRLAVRKLEQVPGVREVKSELYVSRMRPRVEPLRFPLDSEAPTQSASASPDPVSGSLGTLTGRPPSQPVQSVVPLTREPAAGPVTLLAPVAVDAAPRAAETAGPRPVPPAADDSPDLSASVDRLRQGDRRFRRIRTEVRGDTVLLVPGDAPGEHVMAFAQALAHLPGVRGVVVQSGAASVPR